MDWASRKRIKYFIVLFSIFLSGLFFFGYSFLNKPASCTDNKQNGSEAGVDCGGSCQYLCGSQVTKPQLIWARALPSAPKRVSLVAYLKNQNKTAGVISAPYKFTIYDPLGKVIAIKEGVTQIPANGNIAIFAGPVDVGERKIQSTLFEWTAPLYFSSLSERALASSIETINTKIETSTSSTNLLATLRNTTRLSYENTPVVAIVYDTEGNALLASKTTIDELLPEASTDIFFSWNIEPAKPVATIEILPYFEEFLRAQ